LAEKADLSVTYLSDLEGGKQNVSIDALMRLAKALKVAFHDLTRGL